MYNTVRGTLSPSFTLNHRGSKVDQPARSIRGFLPCVRSLDRGRARKRKHRLGRNAIYSRNWIKPSEKVPLSSKAPRINMRLSAFIQTILYVELEYPLFFLHASSFFLFISLHCEISKIPFEKYNSSAAWNIKAKT